MQRIEIRVKGHLDKTWVDRLDGLDITLTPEGTTVLSGPMRDQAALDGVLSRLFGMGLQLISVTSEDRTE